MDKEAYFKGSIVTPEKVKIGNIQMSDGGDDGLKIEEKNNPGTEKKIKAKSIEVQTGFVSHGRGKSQNADLEVEGHDYGLILAAPNGNRYLVQTDDPGNLFTTVISESPEVSMEVRKERMAAKRAAADAAKTQFKNAQNGQLQQRVEALEAMMKAFFNGLE